MIELRSMLLVIVIVCDCDIPVVETTRMLSFLLLVAMVTKEKFLVFALKKSGGQTLFSPGSPKILTVFCFIYCILIPY